MTDAAETRERTTAPADAEAVSFCTEHSRVAGEPLAGWGGHQDRNVLIRWPKRLWRHSLRQAGGMDGAVSEAVEAAFAAGWRINLIDRKGEAEETVRAYLLPAALRFDVAPECLPTLLAAIAERRDLGAFAPQPMRRSLVLCCTHGRHDRCCAKFGFATYRAISAAAGRRWPNRFSVWEATHLGGCRLAASVMLFPEMRKYGRLAPAHAEALLAAEAAGRPYLACYRGNARLSPAAQVAEAAVLERYGAEGLPEVRVRTGSDACVELDVLHAGRRLAVTCAAEEVFSYGACEDLDAREPIEPKVVWRAVRIEEAQT